MLLDELSSVGNLRASRDHRFNLILPDIRRVDGRRELFEALAHVCFHFFAMRSSCLVESDGATVAGESPTPPVSKVPT